jgi:hypothetical protein
MLKSPIKRHVEKHGINPIGDPDAFKEVVRQEPTPMPEMTGDPIGDYLRAKGRI